MVRVSSSSAWTANSSIIFCTLPIVILENQAYVISRVQKKGLGMGEGVESNFELAL